MTELTKSNETAEIHYNGITIAVVYREENGNVSIVPNSAYGVKVIKEYHDD